MRGDATLFTRNDEIEALWGIIDPILTGWREDTSSPIAQYPGGSEGPAEAAALLDGDREVAPAVTEVVWSAERHDARRDRRSAAVDAPRTARGKRRARARARAQHGRGRRPGVEGRSRQPAREASVATTPRARCCARSSPDGRSSTRAR